MKTSVLHVTVTTLLVDLDDAGEIVATSGLEPAQFIGRRDLEDRVAAYLRDVDRICTERTTTTEDT